MLEPLRRNRTYRNLFASQVTSLLGTGLATVALGLLAYDLAGGNAASVVATIFTIKMLAYIIVAPLASAIAERFSRRALLVWLDVVRAIVAVGLPFVHEVWQAYVLVFLLQSASAGFTPAFNATIPDVVDNDEDYTKALSLTRLAQDLENILSPTVAALLLLFVSYGALFWGTAIGFVASAVLILSVSLPSRTETSDLPFMSRATRGIRVFAATPRLRGILALNLGAAGIGSMVLVNTVVIVRGVLDLSETQFAWTMFTFGAGSIVAAMSLPSILRHVRDRDVMRSGLVVATFAFLGLAGWMRSYDLNWHVVLAVWFVVGIGYSAVLTPSGRVLVRSTSEEGRPALFAAWFTLSHACFLITYPLAGWLMTHFGAGNALVVLSMFGIAGLFVSAAVWNGVEQDVIEHTHDDLPLDHPHLNGSRTHAHSYIIDDLHPRWAR